MSATSPVNILIQNKNIAPYCEVWENMRHFCDSRDAETTDEIWFLQHPPTYTLGQVGNPSHLLRDNGIPLIKTDRGGQITYHGPGQLVAYLLLDIRRRHLGLRALVRKMETAVVTLLADYGICACGNENAPGVYVEDQKIAALGLRVCRGGTYHGLSLNVDMDLSPFADINPCGYAGLAVTQMANLCHPAPAIDAVQDKLADALLRELSCDATQIS